MTPFSLDLREFYDESYDCWYSMLVEVSDLDGSILHHGYALEDNAAKMGLRNSTCETWDNETKKNLL